MDTKVDFQSGDKVARKDGEKFSTQEYDATVDYVEARGEDRVWIVDGGWIPPYKLNLLERSTGNDPVVKPSHYTRYEIEPVTFVMRNNIGFAPGNVIKYVCRHDAKNGVEDLKKARRYLDMMINQAEGKPEL